MFEVCDSNSRAVKPLSWHWTRLIRGHIKILPRSDMMPEERPIRDSSRPVAGQHVDSIVSQVV